MCATFEYITHTHVFKQPVLQIILLKFFTKGLPRCTGWTSISADFRSTYLAQFVPPTSLWSQIWPNLQPPDVTGAVLQPPQVSGRIQKGIGRPWKHWKAKSKIVFQYFWGPFWGPWTLHAASTDLRTSLDMIGARLQSHLELSGAQPPSDFVSRRIQ